MSTHAKFIDAAYDDSSTRAYSYRRGLKDMPMCEMKSVASELVCDPTAGTLKSKREAGDAMVSGEWWRRVKAIPSNEFVKTCLLSLISLGPLPPLREHRRH